VERIRYLLKFYLWRILVKVGDSVTVLKPVEGIAHTSGGEGESPFHSPPRNSSTVNLAKHYVTLPLQIIAT